MKVDRALATDGWMDPFELCWLAAVAETHHSIVEIGSFLGRSTRALADNTPGKVYAIDDWKGPRDTFLDDKDGHPYHVDFSSMDLYGNFLLNMVGLHGSKLVIVRQDHKLLDPQYWKDLQPDMVFIDGSHEYEDVCFDINFWKPIIKDKGLLCGHDADRVEVHTAVRELLPQARVVVGTKIWMLDLP